MWPGGSLLERMLCIISLILKLEGVTDERRDEASDAAAEVQTQGQQGAQGKESRAHARGETPASSRTGSGPAFHDTTGEEPVVEHAAS